MRKKPTRMARTRRWRFEEEMPRRHPEKLAFERGRTMNRLCTLLLLLVFVAGCDKTMPTEPSLSPTPAPTATPIPVSQIAGNWSGTLDGDCLFDPFRTPVSAALEQNGTLVTGRFSGGSTGRCSVTGDFTGGLSGNSLVGAIGTISVRGSATESQIVLHLSSPLFFGTLILHR